MDLLESFLGRNGYMPHGYCFTWAPGLLWPMVVADALIAAAYFSIPVAMISFARQRGASPMNWMLLLFSAFIFACGTTHVMDIWTIWRPDYGLQVLTKVVTAAISMATAIALWPLIPKALALPSVAQLQGAIGRLEAEVGRRRSAEEHLADTEQSLAITLASIGAGFITTDRQGRITRINAVAERLLGWTEAEAQGQPLWTVLESEDLPAGARQPNPVDMMNERGISIDRPMHLVLGGRAPQRSAIELKVAVTQGPDSQPRGLTLVFRDLTAQQRAEAESRRLAAIVESSHDAIFGQTLDGRVNSWNEGAHNVFGYTAEEILGQPVQQLVPPEFAAEAEGKLAMAARGERVPTFDTVRRAKDGRLLPVSVTLSPIRDAGGHIVGISRNIRDISETRRAAAALRASEARLRFTLEAAEIGDWSLDLASGVTTHSLRHDRCFGYTEPVPDWSLERFFAHLHAEDRAALRLAFDQSRATQRDWQAECRVIWPDGSLHWLAVHGTPLVQDGDTTGMVGIVTDITRHKQAEAARREAERLEDENRRMQEAGRLKNLFLANMSHELRTPLTAVIGFADLLRSGAVPAASPKHAEYLGHIGSSGRHLLKLINDVLDLSKVEAGKFEFFPEPVQLPAVVDEVRGTLAGALAAKDLQLEIDLDPSVHALVLDPARLRQVLYNFLSNAIKFTPPQGRLALRARPEGPRHVRVEVEDSGIGIKQDDLALLFVEFQQLDAGLSRSHQGTGLGLALTRRLVEAQSGQVGVRSELGVGSVFHLVLPRVQADAESPVPRVLLISHDPNALRAFANEGYAVDAAATGEQALAHARDRSYGAIALQLLLHDERGLGVLEKIRTQTAHRDLAVLGVSMRLEHGDSAAFPVADILSKPIRTEEIVSAMNRLRAAVPRPLRVMVVDDEPLALDLMLALLTGMGITATGVADGRSALAALPDQAPDAMILDLMMPGFDGFAVLDALGRMPGWDQLPVFIWTSMLLTDDEYRQLGQSAQAIASKGGGNLQAVLDALRRWRPPAAQPPADGAPTHRLAPR